MHELIPCPVCKRSRPSIKTGVIAGIDLICVICECGERSLLYSYDYEALNRSTLDIACEIWNNRPHFKRDDGRGACEINLAFKELPTIEPEVRHGRWVEVSNRVTYPIESDVVVKCNTCVHHEVTSRFKLDILRYCTYCGAKMDLRTPTEVQLEEADSVMMGGAENDQI